MSTSKDTFELACDRVFTKLKELALELKKHAHEEIHFNIEHAVQYVEHNKIDLKFKEQIRLSLAEVSQELAAAINDCTTNLNECFSVCQRMGTPAWNSEQDARLTMAWNFFYANLNKAGLMLRLKPLDASAFLAFQRQPTFEPPSFSRRESFASVANSENFSMEGRAERRERAARRRQEQQQQGPMFVTPTGTRLRPPVNRTSPLSTDRESTISSSSSSSSRRPVPPPTGRTPVPEREKWIVDPALMSIPSTPPPEYTPLINNDKPVIPPDEKPPWNPPKPAPVPPATPARSVRSVASEPQLAAPGHHTHYTGNVFHIYQGIPSAPPPQVWHTPQYAPRQPMPPTWQMPMQQPAPQPYRPPRVAAYRPSRLSLRETAALHLTPMPGFAVDIMKPEARCSHGIRHFKGHPPCQWGCCGPRGCGQVLY